MLLRVLDAADHEAGVVVSYRRRASADDRLHLEAGGDETVGKLLRGDADVDEVAEPRER